MQKLLETLPSIASHPLAVVAYVLVAAAWIIVSLRRKRAEEFLSALELQPADERYEFAKSIGYKYDELAQLSQKERLRLLNRRYILIAYLATLAAIVLLGSAAQQSLSYDASELADEHFAQIGSPFKDHPSAQEMKSQFDDLVAALTEINEDIDEGKIHTGSFPSGLFFGKSDVCVERSLQKKGEWIVGVDLVRNSSQGENEIDAIRKLGDIKARSRLLLQKGDEGLLPPHALTLLTKLDPLIQGAEVETYDIPTYIRLYGRELRNSRHLR